MAIYGYARVSTKEQNLSRQLDALRDFGVDAIVTDKLSGSNFERPGYIKLMRKLRENDTLVISSIDRLGRNYSEILEEWRVITKVRKVQVVVLDMPLLDTRNSENKGLTSVFMADMVLQLLSYIAQVERENILERQRQGIESARAQGKHLGRPAMERPEQYAEISDAVRCGEISQRNAAALLGISATTLRKWMREDDEIATGDPAVASVASRCATKNNEERSTYSRNGV